MMIRKSKILRKEAYLVVRELQPGDIVLTSSPKIPFKNNWHVWLIRILTASRYTHASVMMTKLGMLETNGPGNKSQITVPPLLQAHDGKLLLRTYSSHAVVLRPREAALKDIGGQIIFQKSIESAVFAYLGREYADEVDLLSASLIPFSANIARALRRKRNIAAKWFCSSLVAQTYKDASLDLTNGRIEKASPGFFSRNCKLELINHAVRRLRTAEVTHAPEQPNLGCISGALSDHNIESLVATAIQSVRNGHTAVAVQTLDTHLSRLIANPRTVYAKLKSFEKKLQRSGKL